MTSGTLAAPGEARRSRTDRTEPDRAAIERAILQTVAYADVFDYPLTADEIHRYLIGVPTGRSTLRTVLNTRTPRGITRTGRYFSLDGHEASVETRKSRAAKASEYWRKAIQYGRRMSNLPFVRMVAVTGGLAMDNMSDGDIDYLVITEPGRLWLCRALIVGLVRFAALKGTELCPNYFLSERVLELDQRNLFTAHEVTQMVPLAGMATYQRLRDLNRWTYAYLPNADNSPRRIATVEPRPRRLIEGALKSRVCAPVEYWEMQRKIRKLRLRGNGHAEAAFGPDWCKGHFGDHGQATLARYADRLASIDQDGTP